MNQNLISPNFSNIPSDWRVVRLDDIKVIGTTISYGVVQPGETDENGVLFIRGGDIKNGEVSNNLRKISEKVSSQYSRTLLKGGELIVSLVGYPGECAIVPKSLAGANIARQVGLVKIDSSYDSAFIYQYLSSEQGKRNLLGGLVGSAQQVVNLEQLRKVLVPIPSLEEQQRISTILSTVDEKIDVITKQITEIEKFKQGLIQKLLMKGFGNSEFKNSELGDIPDTWKVVTFDELAHNITTKFKAVTGRCVDLEHIEQVTGKLLGFAEISNKASQKNHFISDDVLFGKLRPYLRKFWYETFDGGCTTELMIFRAKQNIDAKFIYYTIQQDSFIANSISKSFGTKMPRTSWDIICEFKLPLPSFEEQKEITAVLTAVDDKIEILKEKKIAYQDLKIGLMQQLLTGKIRVNNYQQQSAVA